MCPLVIDTGALSPDHGTLKADMMCEVDNSIDHDDIQFKDVDMDQHPRRFTNEPGSPNDTLDSTADNSGYQDVSLAWSGAVSSISPSIMPKSKNGGRLISPSKTRRKCDKVNIVMRILVKYVICACICHCVRHVSMSCDVMCHECESVIYVHVFCVQQYNTHNAPQSKCSCASIQK